MKKNFIRFSVIFLFGAVLFTSCNITIAEEKLLTKPNCESTDGKVTIGIRKHSSETSYIQIYKQDITYEDQPVVNLGLIYPDDLSPDGDVYFFTDTFVVNEHTYKYYVRYLIAGEYLKTEWSDEIKISNTLTSEDLFTYNTNDAYFSFNEEDYSLTIQGNVILPSLENYEIAFNNMIIVSNGTQTKVFPIISVTAGTVINLKALLTSEFLNTNITIQGICGQKTEYTEVDPEVSSEEPRVTRITWTPSANMKISGYSENTIYISSSNEYEGFDYSRQLNKN